MGDIDRKISAYTRDFTRWVDDVRIFVDTHHEAAFLLHELSKYLYTSHRLVLSEQKTTIVPTSVFLKRYQKSAEKQEREAILEKAVAILDAKREELRIPYGELFIEAIDDDENENEDVMESLEDYEKFEATVTAYRDLLTRCLASERLDVSLVRHLLKQATELRVRSLVPIVLKHFERLLPVIREVVIYLDRVLSEATIKKHEKLFRLILSSECLKLPLINIWVFTLLQNKAFNDTGVSTDYNRILRIREQALLAKARNDKTWVKDHKDSLDVLGPWDKRAVLHAASVLSADEMRHWAGLAAARGDIVDKAICARLVG